eukprot:scaffold70241_cov21-Tisochrysis_lutea.AAC.1
MGTDAAAVYVTKKGRKGVLTLWQRHCPLQHLSGCGQLLSVGQDPGEIWDAAKGIEMALRD